MARFGTVLGLFSLLAIFSGCGAMAPNASMAGVTTGGAQDIGLARNQVAAGQIPSPAAFVVEGLLSEHDIDIEPDGECARAFCLSTATGLAPALDTGEDAAFTVLGFSSNLGTRRPSPTRGATTTRCTSSATSTRW